MTGTEKEYLKVIVLDLEGKFMLGTKWEKWVIFGPKVNTFELYSRSVYQIFLKF